MHFSCHNKISSFKALTVCCKTSRFKADLKESVNKVMNINYCSESFVMIFFFFGTFYLYSYHNEIIEKEDFSLVCCLFLGLVDIRHFKKSTAAHQSSVRDRQDLHTGKIRVSVTHIR